MIVGVVNAIGRAGDLQLDAEAEIRENGVAENGVVDVPVPGVCSDHYSVTKEIARPIAVEGDDVARAGGRAANGVVVAGVAAGINYQNALLVIAQRLSACEIGADDVALDEIARRAGHFHTSPRVTARDHIPRRRAGSSCQSADDSAGAKEVDA